MNKNQKSVSSNSSFGGLSLFSLRHRPLLDQIQRSMDPVTSLTNNGVSPVTLTTESVPTRTRTSPTSRSDATRHLPLHRRQFYHSRTAQPMTLDEVMSDRDSEDEVDSDCPDPKDQPPPDATVDKDQEDIKRFMQLWNSFVKTQRVLADGHVPWACEAFSKFHEKELLQNPSLYMCWRLFMMKLWGHGLVTGATINNCNTYLQNRRDGKETTDIGLNRPSTSSSNNNRVNRRPKILKKNNNNSGNDAGTSEPGDRTGIRKSTRTRAPNKKYFKGVNGNI